MKTSKFLFAGALLLLCSASYAQKKQQLTTRIMPEWDESYYSYNEEGLLDSMHVVLKDIGHYESYRLYTYDDKNLCTRLDDYQLLGNEFVHVSYVEYTYDEEGRMKTRINYNSYGTPNFEVGGKITWDYNSEGVVDKETTYLLDYKNPGNFALYKEDRYTYKDGKKKRKESWVVPFDAVTPDQMFLESSIDYTYNTRNLPLEDIIKSYDSVTGAMTSSSRNNYKFDEEGNLTEFTNYMGLTSRDPVVKYVYHHDLNLKRDETVLPFNFEDQAAAQMVAMTLSPNLIVKEEWWQMPMETDELIHGGDYIWTYESNETGISQMQGVLNEVNAYVVNNQLYFKNLKPGTAVEVYNTNGALVQKVAYQSNGIALNNLPKGIYVTRAAGTQAFRFVK